MYKKKFLNKSNSYFFSIFDHKNFNKKISRKFCYLKFKSEIKWIFEYDNSVISVLKKWRPYSFWSYILWRIIIILKILKILDYLPLSNGVNLKISKELLNYVDNLNFEQVSFLCYLSSENHPKQKAIIFVVDKAKKRCSYIIKKAISPKSWHSLQNEYSVLKQLEKEKNKFSPRALYLDNSNKSIFQEYIDGAPVSLSLKNEHYTFLASLVNKNKYIDFPKIKSFISANYDIKLNLFSNKKEIKDLNDFLNLSIWDKKIQSVRIHGDFVPWNLKYNKKNKKFTAYDWEDSIDSFLPFYDLIFYKLTVKKLLNKRVEINKEKYLNALNLRGLHDRYVKDIYLISKILFLIKSKI